MNHAGSIFLFSTFMVDDYKLRTQNPSVSVAFLVIIIVLYFLHLFTTSLNWMTSTLSFTSTATHLYYFQLLNAFNDD